MRRGSFWTVLLIFVGLFGWQNLNAMEPDQGNTELVERCKCSGNFEVFADLLAWRASQSGSENWGQTYTDTEIKIHQVSFPWDLGFRVGVGADLSHDQWDTELYYTQFYTEGKDRESSPDEITSPFLGNFYIDNAFGIEDSGPTYHRSRIRWKIRYNVFDWELGRLCCVSKSLSLRPFIGLKGGRISQKIRSNWDDPEDALSFLNPFTSATENIDNKFWGIGPSTGMNSSWKLGSLGSNSFLFFGDFSGALLWGHWTFRDVYRNDAMEKVTVKLSNINGASTVLRSYMGLEWNTDFNRDRFCLTMRFGYEMQFWLDQLQFYSLNVGRLINVLTLQGGTFELRIHF